MSEDTREVYRALREAQNKYTYFLLAAAGAAMALSVNQTQGVALAWSQVSLGAGVLSWGLSFFFGLRHLGYVTSTLYANAELLRVESGQHPEFGSNPQMMAAANQGIREAIKSKSDRAVRTGHLQFGFMIAGAVLYFLWHVLEMYLSSVSQPELN